MGLTSSELIKNNDSKLLYTELELLNFAIAMCMNNSTYEIENILYQTGYRIISIDRSVDTSVGTLKYDLCLSCKEKEMTIGLEIKGGLASNISNDQLKKYKEVEIYEFIRGSGITFNDSSVHQLSTIIMCNTIRKDEVRKNLKELGYDFSVLSIDANQYKIYLDSSGVIDKELLEKINSKSKIIKGGRIPYFVKFDKESLAVDVARSVITEYVRFVLEKRNSFQVDEMIENVYCGIPGLMKIIGADVKKNISRTVRNILRQMSKKHFKKFLEWDTEDKVWLINNINESNNLSLLKSLKGKGESFLLEIEGKKSEDLIPEGQLSFEDFELMHD